MEPFLSLNYALSKKFSLSLQTGVTAQYGWGYQTIESMNVITTDNLNYSAWHFNTPASTTGLFVTYHF